MTNLEAQKLRIAVVGCGRISKKHFEAIQQHNDCLKLVAICEPKEEQRELMAKQLKVPGYQNLEQMIENVQLDVVALCTPSGLHAEQTILAAKNGISIITEKPMATRWNDGLRMVKECDENNVKLFVVKQNRQNDTLKKLKATIDERRFGTIHMVHINVFWTRPQSYYDQAKWRGTWEFDGGALMNQASHYVDLMDWLIGPVEKLQCITSTTRQIEVEDSAVLNVKWRNGTICSSGRDHAYFPKKFRR